MDSTEAIVQSILLDEANINQNHLDASIGMLMHSSVDYADLYFEYNVNEWWGLEDSIVKSGSYDLAKGVGARAVAGEKTGFAYSDEIQLGALENAVKAASQITKQGKQGIVKIKKEIIKPPLYEALNPITSLSSEDKVALLRRADAYARSLDPRVIQANIGLSGNYQAILVVNSDGQMAYDIRPMIRFDISIIAEQGGKRETAYQGGGIRGDYHYFTEAKINEYIEEAVRIATLNLAAEQAPAGNFPVALGPGWPGVLLHEAVGHGLEGDFNRKKTSAFSGKIGQQVASSLCTVVDDGTLPNRRGSLTIDDEGTPSQCNVLIENGILKSYMQDKMNAKLMGMEPTGNGRRESYADLPMPRMTNTYMLPGKSDPQEIIASIDDGIYAVNFGGGQVDITSGKFVFSISEGYRVKNGKVLHPIKGATLIGNGPEVMQRISMVGNDLELDSGVGICGKDGQSVPVGVGQPTLRVDDITVGGTVL